MKTNEYDEGREGCIQEEDKEEAKVYNLQRFLFK